MTDPLDHYEAAAIDADERLHADGYHRCAECWQWIDAYGYGHLLDCPVGIDEDELLGPDEDRDAKGGA